MNMETGHKIDAAGANYPLPDLQTVLFAQTPDAGTIVGVLTDSEPSSLSLLAAGVAGIAARQARRERIKPAK